MDSKNNKNKLCILQITFKYKSMTPEQTYMYVIFQKILELKKNQKDDHACLKIYFLISIRCNTCISYEVRYYLVNYTGYLRVHNIASF